MILIFNVRTKRMILLYVIYNGKTTPHTHTHTNNTHVRTSYAGCFFCFYCPLARLMTSVMFT